MRWRNRVLCTIAAVVALTTTGVAIADPDPPAFVRAAETFTDWTGGPSDDAQDRDLGRYQFETQTFGGARRALDSASNRYTPERLADEETLRVELQALYDGVLHDRPNLPDNNMQESADPDLLPDWDGDGVYGEAGSGLSDRGDYDRDLDQRRDAAWFRYPTFHEDGTVTHVAGQRGAAIEAGFVNSRGLFIDATLWVPGDLVESLDPDTDEVELLVASTPALVFSNGVSSSQIMYYWFAQAMVARGYVVLTYDPAGQGQSDGTWTDTFQQNAGTGDCYFGGACLDLRDAVRWMVGDPIEPRPDLMGYEGWQMRPFAGPRDPADFPANPLVPLVHRASVGLAGNSMGALATLNYLTAMETDPTLPRLKSAVAMSGATASAVVSVPLQLQTSDFDGSPTLVGPGVGGVPLGGMGQGIGYYPIKDMLDRLGPGAPHATSLVVIKGGVHTDHTRVPYVPRARWATKVASDYAGAWFDCHVRGLGGACAAAMTSSAGLSEAFGSEAHGPAPTPTATCIKAPTVMSLNYDAQDLAAMRPRACHGRAS